VFLGIRWGSLHAKIFAWTFVPTAVILVAVGLVAVRAFQQTAQALVIERDREITRLYAGEIAVTLERYADVLTAVVRDGPAVARRGDVVGETLRRAREHLAPFDGGVVLLDEDGKVMAAEPPTTAARGSDWSSRRCFLEVRLTGETVFSDILPAGPDAADVVAVAVPTYGEGGSVIGAVVGMFRVDRASAGGLHETMRALPVVDRASAYLVDATGRAIFHSDPSQIGTDLTGSAVVALGATTQTGAQRIRTPDGRDVLASFALVPGTPWRLFVEEDWSRPTAATRRYAQLLVVLLLLGVLVPAIVVASGVRRITRPIGDLIQAAQEVAKGHFGHTIEADTGDEIEELARQFNIMSAELQTSVSELEQRVRDRTTELADRTEAEHRRAEQFRVIADVGRQMSAILPLDELLSRIARVIQEAFGLYHVGIGLVEGDVVVYRAGAGAMWSADEHGTVGPGFEFRPGRLRVGEEGITGLVAGSGETIVVPDVTGDPRYVEMAGTRARSEFVVPIRTRGGVIGVIDVQSDRIDGFDASDVAVVESLANFAAIAIDNARLYEKGRHLAVLEERQRVARELHDSVTQALYGVTLYGDAAARLLAVGESEQARAYVVQLRDTAREALQEMRLLIFEMRPPELAKVGLAAALQARLDAVEGRAGMKTDLVTDGPVRAAPDVEDALYRIAQEALNNAFKHARARSVRIALRADQSVLRLEVVDDGVGFDPEQAHGGGGMGMGSMRERAAQVGARLSVSSSPGAGTRVTVEVPL
jgi:signal transduction histidine kinase